MRKFGLVLLVALAACGADPTRAIDAAVRLDASIERDAAPRPDARVPAPDAAIGHLDAFAPNDDATRPDADEAADASNDGGLPANDDAAISDDDGGASADDAAPGPDDAAPADDAAFDGGVVDTGPRARVVYSRSNGAQADLFANELDGTREEQLTRAPGADLSPTWSPNGRTIAFASSRNGRFAIHRLDWATRTATIVTRELIVSLGPAYSPDGRTIAFQGRIDAMTGFDIFTVTSSGGPAIRLTTATGNDSGPTWSPDGRTIYFVSNRSGPFEIYAMNSDGSNQRAITSGSLVVGRPFATPDGRSLLYGDGDPTTVVVRLDLATSMTAPLTDDQDAEPSVGPDGRWMVFSTLRFGDPEIMVLDLMTGGAMPVRITTDPAVDGTPAIGPPVF